MTEMSNSEFNKFDDDEAEHLRNLSEDVLKHLALARNAAIITLNGLMSLEMPIRLNEPEGIILFLMAKCAKTLRFSLIGLKIGYYSGAATLLRSAFESLAHAFLFDADPKQVAIWLRNEFSSRPQYDLDVKRSEQTRDAKKALLHMENDPRTIKEATDDFWQGANKYTHATLQGLAKEFGVDISDLVPDELAQTEEDLDWALERYILLSTYGKDMLKSVETNSSDTEPIEIQLLGKYDEEVLLDLSLFAFYVGHRLLDMTNVLDIKDMEFQKQYKEWHEAIKNI